MDALSDGVEFVGFVFYDRSPRRIQPRDAASLIASYASGPRPVGLFVDPAEAEIARVLDVMPLAALQVYAPPARAAALQSRFGIDVWCCIGVSARHDLPGAIPGVARILLDAKPPASSDVPGGNAAAFDWSLLDGWPAPAHWVLAGGLTPETVGPAIRRTGAPTVDVSSGVERVRGEKDPDLIRAFISAVRAADLVASASQLGDPASRS